MDFKYVIRKATEKDVDDIMVMVVKLAEYEKKLDECDLTAETFCKDGFSDDPAFNCLVAESRSNSTGVVELVGYALFYYIYSSVKGRNVYLEDLYVKEPYRKHGIGKDLMKNVAKIAVEKGCSQYRFACLGWNSNALKFYKSVGARDMTGIEDCHLMSFERKQMQDFANELDKK